MDIVRKIINSNKKQQKRYRNKDLTLAMILGTTFGVLAGIAVKSKPDKINKVIERIKNKSTESMRNGRDKVEDLLEETMIEIEYIKENVKEEFNDMKDKSEDVKEELNKD